MTRKITVLSLAFLALAAAQPGSAGVGLLDGDALNGDDDNGDDNPAIGAALIEIGDDNDNDDNADGLIDLMDDDDADDDNGIDGRGALIEVGEDDNLEDGTLLDLLDSPNVVSSQVLGISDGDLPIGGDLFNDALLDGLLGDTNPLEELLGGGLLGN